MFTTRVRSPLRSNHPLVVFLALLRLGTYPLQASAEWYPELYGGATHPPRSDVTLIIRLPSGPFDHVFHDVKWDDSASVGGRAGYWSETLPWLGVGLDVFHFGSNLSTQTVLLTISAIGFSGSGQLQAIDFSIHANAFHVVGRRGPFLRTG